MLVSAIAIELALLAACLFVRPLTALLGHAPPSTAGWIVAALTGPAVLLADAVHKRIRHWSSRSTQRLRPENIGRGRA